MTKEKLNEIFGKCKELRQGIRIELEMPGQRDPEVIINTYDSLEIKRRYYEKTYNDNLVHKNNNRIRIIDAQPIQIIRKPKRIIL